MFTHVVTRRALNWKGWLLVIYLVFSVFALFVSQARDFFVVNQPVEADILVIEGWVDDYTLKAAVERIQHKGYSTIITSGGPFNRGAPFRKEKTEAARAKRLLTAFGINEERIAIAPTQEAYRNRTYAAGVAVNRWLDANGFQGESFNLLTADNHGRRSHQLFEMAAQGSRQIGIISVPSPAYDDEKWWTSSSGFRTTMGEVMAYIYVQLLFWP